MAWDGCEAHYLSTRLPPTPSSVSAARHFANEAVTTLGGCADAAERAQLLVSELATNVVVHASTPMRVSVCRPDDYLRVEVRDDEPRHPDDVGNDLLAPGGRGLLLVDAIARAWGVNGNDRGKTVWFELGVD
jgi:anti-sigma regulatory factor (Ser/Thr protein kinase)